MTIGPEHPTAAEPRTRPVAADPPVTEAPTRAERREVLRGQRARFGGIKWGSAFFGWLTAVGTAALLSGIVAAVGTGFGTTTTGGPAAPVLDGGALSSVGVVSVVVVAAVLFVAYYCGGYVAGRMARFDGARQGLAVWLWAVVVAVAVIALATVVGIRLDPVPAGTLVGLPVDPATLGTAGFVAAAVALLVGLAGAVLGGLAGMRFHRRIDRVVPEA
ncbi:hypothetical protein ACVGOW_20960 [Pseudonocardia saturnea]